MEKHLSRSIKEPIRNGLDWNKCWKGADNGLIYCWERGRGLRDENPSWAERAENGELIPLWWQGGVENKLKMDFKPGTLFYLATWQGLRNEDLSISLDEDTVLVCSKTGQAVKYSSNLTGEDE